MGRKRKLRPEQEAEIFQAHIEGLGIKRLVRRFGVGFSLVVRILRRAVRPQKALPGSPQKALPVEEPREQRFLPVPPAADNWYKKCFPYYGPKVVVVPPGVKLVHGKCPMCESATDIIEGVGICPADMERELHTFHSRPIGWGRCVSCAEPRAIHQMTGSGPMCGRHKVSAFMYSAAEVAERTPPKRDSMGMWWDPDGAGGAGCWKA